MSMAAKKEYEELKAKSEANPQGYMDAMQPGGRYNYTTLSYESATPQGGEGTKCITSLKPGKMFICKNSVGPVRRLDGPISIAMAAFKTKDPLKATRLALERLNGSGTEPTNNVSSGLKSAKVKAGQCDLIQPQPTTHRWLTPQQAADHLQCSKSFLDKDRLEGQHKIPYSRLGRHIRYDRHDLNTWLESQKTGGDQ